MISEEGTWKRGYLLLINASHTTTATVAATTTVQQLTYLAILILETIGFHIGCLLDLFELRAQLFEISEEGINHLPAYFWDSRYILCEFEKTFIIVLDEFDQVKQNTCSLVECFGLLEIII